MNNKTKSITLDEIEKSAGALALLGYVLTYRLMGIRVQAAELLATLKGAGLESHLPALPSPRKALRRALKAWIHKRTEKEPGSALATAVTEDEESETEESQRTLIRVINRPGAEHLVFGIVSEDVDFNSLGLSYGTQLRILLHRKTGEILCTTDARGVISAENESKLIADELLPFWKEYRTLYFSEDLSKMVRSIIIGMNGVSLRKEGGVYFVPRQEREQVEMARELLSHLPTAGADQPFLCAVPVPDVEASKGQMAKAIHYGFMDEIRSMATDLEHLVEAKPGTVRTDTISKRLLQYKEVKEKVDMYATLLSVQQTNIQKELETLTAKARAVVTSESGQSRPKEKTQSSGSPRKSASAPSSQSEDPDHADLIDGHDEDAENAAENQESGSERNTTPSNQQTTLAASGHSDCVTSARSAPGRGENLMLFV